MTLLSPRIDTTSTQSSSGIKELLWVLIFFMFILAVENVLVFVWAWQLARTDAHYTLWEVYSIAMLFSAATAFVAGLIGFLFGIPHSGTVERSRQRAVADQKTEAIGDAAGPQGRSGAISVVKEATMRNVDRGSGLQRNTSLESISDALTKGLLAIGVSQMYNLGRLTEIGKYLGPSFGPGSAGSIVALSVLIYSASAGFLFAYLASRIYLTSVFERNDPKETGE
jgi:hypothetical protein